MAREHEYELDVTWTGNRGSGTSNYRAYGRDHTIGATGVPPILGSSDVAFRGDPTRWNPEQLFLASIANCHMLWYLHLAARANVCVVGYRDRPAATMTENSDGGGQFTSITLRPHVTVDVASDLATAEALHGDVARYCFVARSINVPIDHLPTIEVAPDSPAD